MSNWLHMEKDQGPGPVKVQTSSALQRTTPMQEMHESVRLQTQYKIQPNATDLHSQFKGKCALQMSPGVIAVHDFT